MKRRWAREMVLKILFQIFVGNQTKEEVIEEYLNTKKLDKNLESFILDLVDNTLEHLDQIDQIIQDYSIDWDLDRLGNVELNILRFAIYELLYREDIPSNVTINEAIEITKKYTTIEASKFVNGILGKINQDYNKLPQKDDNQNGD